MLAEQGTLGDKICIATFQIDGSTEKHRMARRLGEMEKGCFEESEEMSEQLGQPMVEGEYVVGLQESGQKLSVECMQRSARVKFRTDGVFRHHGLFFGASLSQMICLRSRSNCV